MGNTAPATAQPAPKSIEYLLPGAPGWKTYAPDRGRDDPLREHLLHSVQMPNLLALCGSGVSLAAGLPSMEKLWDEALAAETDIARVFAAVGNVPRPRIEELLSNCLALQQLKQGDFAYVDEFYRRTTKIILDKCSRHIDTDDPALNGHRELLRRLSKRRARDPRFKCFTTNYDRLFEQAASALRLVALDGFTFTHPRTFDPRFFTYDVVHRPRGEDTAAFIANAFQYFKLHGSVDWQLDEASGETSIVHPPDPEKACLIYPARNKYQLSYRQPHLELMAQYLSALREPNSCLIVAGFGFADEHLAAPILAAVNTNQSFRLVVVDRSPRKKIADRSPETKNWVELARFATTHDVCIVEADFDAFVRILPEQQRLSAEGELARAVANIAKKARRDDA